MIESILGYEEGLSLVPYIDSEGYPTIGKGTKIGPVKPGNITNDQYLLFYEIKITEQIADLLLDMRVTEKRNKLMKLSWYMNLNDARQEIVLSMAYQMGVSSVCKFTGMIAAAKAKDWDKMADEALDSKWHKQTPARAERHALVLRTGKLESVKEYC